ncbi:coiled-coil domain-containing protein 22 homolog [Leguminivora glycinivorella]|uniref:coiled-coil domain-containing protein 22 homolog n=1 Tax=Leguminivora glycinivorella TaxID=1035111 RepID=UPI00200F0AF9|nr:coiled-coil domain-containing protein 22 homolog [Leguminivora glycinivorella]
MEEVDSIILHFLRQLNVNIDEGVKNICELPVEVIIESASKCLSAISTSIKVPTKLPSGISHRIEVAAHIALICKDLGYKNDVGYQTFLYYNEAELRQVFMFLIERLPTENKAVKVATGSCKSSLLQAISSKIQEELAAVWIPPCCNPSNTQPIGDCAQNTLSIHKLPKTDLNEQEIILNLRKMKEFTQDTNYNQENTEIKNDFEMILEDKPTTPVNYDGNKSLKELKEAAVILRQKLDELKSDSNLMEAEFSQVQKSKEKIEADLRNVQNILHSIGISDIDNEDVTNVLEKVQNSMNVLHRKSEELTSANLTLKVEIDKIKNSIDDSESERNRARKTLISLKESAKAMKDEYDKKEQNKNQLKQNYEKLKGGNKRSIYTKRILEIISNVDKQNMEIKKILDDTRELQKEINTLEGQLDRCFAIADETLFKDAKKDDQAKKAYKLLALLHSECNTIVSLVNDTGIFARDIIDIEDNIKNEKAKRTEDTLQKIQLDLKRMQEEHS